MTILSEKAAGGNQKASEKLYLEGRGFSQWLLGYLGCTDTGAAQKTVWGRFIRDLKNGAFKEGDSLERILIGYAVSCVSGTEYVPAEEGAPYSKPIKFPGDIEAGAGYMDSILSKVPEADRAVSLLCMAGFGKDGMDGILGHSADAGGAASALADAAKETAAGKYNINVPAPEMLLDVMSRSSARFKADGEPDSEILSLTKLQAARKQEPEQKDTGSDRSRNNLWKYIAACLCVAVIVFAGIHLFGKGSSENEGGTGVYDGERQEENGGDDTDDSERITGYVVEMVVEDYGTITIELDRTSAPRTVKNFIDLVEKQFYDGLTFHRIMNGFMMQGGDPEGNGTGGSDKKILGEFSKNGVDNPISHVRGVISMARSSNDYNSARSQFFICQADCTYLDGNYAAFGHVTSGMDVVDRICEEANPIDDNGTIPASEQPVIESVKILEVLTEG